MTEDAVAEEKSAGRHAAPVDSDTPADEDSPLDTAEFEKVASEARKSFSLVDAIKNRSMRTVKLDLGFDEVNSEKLVGIEAALGQLRVILDRAERNVAQGEEFQRVATELKQKIAEAEQAHDSDEAVAALRSELYEAEREVEQREGLRTELQPLLDKAAELEESAQKVRDEVKAKSLSVELRALPYAIARGSSRRARKALGITQKGIPADLQEDFEERQLLEIAYDQVARWRDNRTGEEGAKLEMTVIEAMRDFLPLSQSAKFFDAVSDLQFKNAISESAIAQADF